MDGLAEKIGQLLIVGFDGLRPPRHILEWLAQGKIGGVALFARNIASPAQVESLVAACRAAARHPILVGIDQEGGVVARLRAGFSESPGAMALGAARDPGLAEDVGAMLGRELAALGINWNYAPVADIALQSGNPSVGARSVGRDPNSVSDMVRAQIRGFQRAGVAATVKHFPGLGGTIVDTHDAPAHFKGDLEDLRRQDLLPFRAAIKSDVACVMLTHVIYDTLDRELPATLSPRIVNGLLRGELGYAGAVCSDCMEMNAITQDFGAGESAVLSLLAGVDLVLFSHTREKQEAAFDALLAAAQSGRLSEARIDQSLRRIRALKRRFALDDRPPLDVVGCEAHRSLAIKAARAGTVLLKRGDAMPIDPTSDDIALVEFASQPALAPHLRRRLPQVVCHRLDPAADFGACLARISAIAGEAETVILVTREAHRQPTQRRLAQQVCDLASEVILICARAPYDAGIIQGADSVLCTHGDSARSLQAAVDIICGDAMPGGALTVSLR